VTRTSSLTLRSWRFSFLFFRSLERRRGRFGTPRIRLEYFAREREREWERASGYGCRVVLRYVCTERSYVPGVHLYYWPREPGTCARGSMNLRKVRIRTYSLPIEVVWCCGVRDGSKSCCTIRRIFARRRDNAGDPHAAAIGDRDQKGPYVSEIKPTFRW